MVPVRHPQDRRIMEKSKQKSYDVTQTYAHQRVLDKEEQRALKRSERKGKEDSWMLPGLLDSEQDQSSKRDKKKKKKSKKSRYDQ